MAEGRLGQIDQLGSEVVDLDQDRRGRREATRRSGTGSPHDMSVIRSRPVGEPIRRIEHADPADRATHDLGTDCPGPITGRPDTAGGVTEFDLATTETVEEPWLSLRAQRLLLGAVVVFVAGAALVGSSMLARADTGEVRPAVDAAAVAADPGPARNLASVLPAASLGAPLPDHEQTATTPDAAGALALDGLPFDWQLLLPDWSIEFAGFHDELLGGTSWQEQRITIWVRPGQTIGQIRHVVAHEIGHALDVTYFDEAVRVRWMAERGFAADDGWWPESGENDYASPAGDLAETMATWVNGTHHWAGMGERPTGDDVALLRELLVTSLI